MKHLSKSFLTLLALTLFGAGAWAQGPTNVTRITTDMIASWATDINHVTLADLQALGFVAVDASVAQAWTGAPQDGLTCLFYGFNESDGDLFLNYIMFNGGNVTPGQSPFTKSGFYTNVRDYNFFYTGSPAIELTKVGANQWTLGQMPDYDVELQVEYYQPFALKDIPQGWQIRVNGVDKTTAVVGDSLMITETDSVTLVPDNPRRVKSVTLADEGPVVQSVNIDGINLLIAEGDTWQDILDRNPGVIWYNAQDELIMSDYGFLGYNIDYIVYLTNTYNPSVTYFWEPY